MKSFKQFITEYKQEPTNEADYSDYEGFDFLEELLQKNLVKGRSADYARQLVDAIEDGETNLSKSKINDMLLYLSDTIKKNFGKDALSKVIKELKELQ